MTMTEKNHSPAGANPATSTTAPAPTVLDRMGGPKGFVYSTIPVVAFVAADAFLSLPAMITVAIAVALALTGYRLLHGEPFSAAIGGLVGVAAAVGIVVLTGSVSVIGIWVALAGFVATFGSVLARRPLTGVVWNLLHGGPHDWRTDRIELRAHDVATLAAAAVLGARVAVWAFGAAASGSSSRPDRSVRDLRRWRAACGTTR
jgi:hypothetical protein